MNTTSSIRESFPQFRNRHYYPDTMIGMAIDESILDMGSDEERWGDAYDYAQRNLVAHKLTIAMRQSAGDASSMKDISSKTAGGVSVSYQQGSQGYQDQLGATSYGQVYLSLRMTYIGAFLIA